MTAHQSSNEGAEDEDTAADNPIMITMFTVQRVYRYWPTALLPTEADCPACLFCNVLHNIMALEGLSYKSNTVASSLGLPAIIRFVCITHINLYLSFISLGLI